MQNEAEVLSMLQQVEGVAAHLVDLAQLSLADQIQLVAADTDILVGDAHPPLLMHLFGMG